MPDRPIIFSAPMIQALLAGRKTQTRRLAWRPFSVGNPWAYAWQQAKLGDRLWVREAFSEIIGGRNLGEDDATFYRATDPVEAGPWHPSIHMPRRLSRITLTVLEVRVQQLHAIDDQDACAEGVVSREDGSWHVPGVCHPDPAFPWLSRSTPREMFAALWDTVHGSGAWLQNPVVVAITFTTARRNIDAVA